MTVLIRRLSPLTGFFFAAACAPTSSGPGRGFDINFPENRPADLADVAGAVASAPAPETHAPYVVMTAPPPARGLTAYSLPDGQRLWQLGTTVDARPIPLGDIVLTHGEGNVIALDATRGEVRWTIPDRGYSLIGAGSDGRHVAITLGPGGLNQRQGVLLAVDARSGTSAFARDVEQALGVPAVAGGYVFVPWNGQYLSVVDVRNGSERTRIRSTDDVFSFAESEGSAVYFGARVLYRLAGEAASGHRQGTPTLAPPRDDLPGNPPMLQDGYMPARTGINARERVALISRPDPSVAGAALIDGTVYALFHRIVFAVSADGGSIRWAYPHTADIAGAEVVRGGLILVDDQGNAAMLDNANGNVAWRQALGGRGAQAVVFAPLDFSPPRTPAESPTSNVTSLIAAAGGTDTRLLPARIFATQALGAIPGPEATRGLLDIASRANYPQELRSAAGEALSRRTEGTDPLVDGLVVHYDYIRQTAAPPVGFIARALAAAHDRRGIPALIAHLQDPETPASELPPLVAALKEFGDASAVPALLDFLRLYHADDGAVPGVDGGDPVNDRSYADQQLIESALEQAVLAVAQLGGPRERRWLQAMYEDRNTLPPLRPQLGRATSTETSTGTATTQTSTPTPPGPTAANAPPGRHDRDGITDAFASVRDRMMRCFDGAPSRPSQVRIQFRYDGQGNISHVTVTPAQWTPCLAPLANSVRLPPSQVSREIGTYFLIGAN